MELSSLRRRQRHGQHSSGLCGPCQNVAALVRAEARMHDDVNGVPRRELVERLSGGTAVTPQVRDLVERPRRWVHARPRRHKAAPQRRYPAQRHLTAPSPYRQVLEALRALASNRDGQMFHEATSALCRSADLDGASGLLRFASCVLSWWFCR